MIKKILVPTDFSGYADNAVRLAARIASKSNSAVDLLHVVSVPVNWVGIPVVEEKLFPEAKAAVAKAKETLNAYKKLDEFKGIKVDTHVYVNESTAEIARHVGNLNADLIVMGAHGANKFSEMLMGSATRKILRLSNIPLITTSNQSNGDFQLKKIVITSDFSQKSIESFKPVFELAKLFDSEIVVIWVDVNFEKTEDEFMVEQLKDILKDKYGGIHRLNVIHSPDVTDSIISYANQMGADLIATATHGRKGVTRLILGSVTENLINNSPVPVMAVYMNQEKMKLSV